MKRDAYLEYRSSSVFENMEVCYSPPADKSSREMGLAPGGLMKQELVTSDGGRSPARHPALRAMTPESWAGASRNLAN